MPDFPPPRKGTGPKIMAAVALAVALAMVAGDLCYLAGQ